MVKLWGSFKNEIQGGFEMSSKHDIMTLIITLVLIGCGTFLVVSGHMTSGISNVVVGVLPAIFGYWFGRGGSVSATDSMKAGGTNAGNTPSNGANQS